MVFEAVVVDVLNRFLGSYVENLNKDQLKLGIWGGDVVLQNLTVKQTALEELNFPVKTVFGHLGKLVLKIPWKNLYGASVEASIDNLLLIVHPIAEVKYNAEKEEKQALADKQAELRRIEDVKKREADKDKPKIDETFVEKLATQIIKNVQLKIARIHIRYEDTITNPDTPFSCGLTLHNLSVHTTDANWMAAVASEAVTKIFKILTLEGLSIYWNENADIYSKMDSNQVLDTLRDRIATKTTKGLHYKYLLGPINATAKLQLNPKPECDEPPFKVPKVLLTLHMEELAISLRKDQYQGIMRLMDSFDMMTKAAPYRKYRPDLTTYRGHYKVWWHFAYKCILEEDVRRRRNNWNWAHMKAYRDLCRSYANAYMQYKLSSKGKVPPETTEILEKGEKELAILSLVILKQQMDTEVEKIKQEEKAAMQQKTWFSRWWYGGGVEASDSDLNLIKRFEAEITPEEKAKLYRAIDYQESSAPQDFPLTFASIDARFTLDKLLILVKDKGTVLRGAVTGVEIDFAQRPSADAIRVDVSMQKFSVYGVQQGDIEPQLVASKEVSEDVKLINISFETNPLDGKCDSRVIVSARPLEIKYDAQTIIEIVKVFKPPQDTTALSTLQEAAALKLLDLKEKSATGMQYMIDKHTLIDLDIKMDSSYIVVPHSGLYKGTEACCVIQLGTISLKSEPRTGSVLNINEMYQQGYDEGRIFNEVSSQCYDKLIISLTAMQVVLSYENEDWRSSLSSTEATDLHLLEPTNLVLRLHKCVIEDDPRMPKLKVFGDLENVYISAAEDRLYKLFEILIDMPLPQSEGAYPLVKYLNGLGSLTCYSTSTLDSRRQTYKMKTLDFRHFGTDDSNAAPSRTSSMSLLKYLDSTNAQKNVESASLSETSMTQLTNVEALFVMKELKITMKRQEDNVYDKYLVFSLNLLQAKATQKTYTLTSEVKLGAIGFNQYRKNYDSVSLIDTPLWRSGSGDQYMFNIKYYNVDKKCPEFRSFYQSVEQLIEFEFSNVNVLLHLECLQQLLVIANEYQTRLNEMQMLKDRVGDAGPLETIREDEELVATKSKTSAVEKKGKRHKVETIHLKVMINIKNIGVGFATDGADLTDVQLKNMAAGLILKDSYTQVDCLIGDVKIIDLFPTTIHREILKVVKGEVANIRVVFYNQPYKAPNNVDMSVNVEFSCLRVVFMNRYVTSMLGFLNNFQEAQNRIIEASSQAAGAARANVQSAYENSTKIDMKLKLDAPIIVVPENSISRRALLFDFGKMHIDNKFVDLPVVDSTTKVTTDELILDLEDMKLTYIHMDGHGDTTSEKTILQPISCSLSVKRNLSLWYDKIPDLEVSGRLKSIVLTLTRDDYQSIMNILTQNLKEGAQEPAKKPRHPIVTERPTRESVRDNKSRVTLAPSSYSMITLGRQPQELVKTTIKFQFTMDSFVIDLFHMVNDKLVSLAEFRLVLLCMRGRMLSDNSIHASILLIDVTLDDMRPGREDKITRYLERRRSGRGDGEEIITADTETTTKEVRSMVDITYTTKNSDTFIDMRVYSFNLILAMDFMNKLLAFLSVEEEDKEKFIMKEIREEAVTKKRSTTGTAMKNVASKTSDILLEEDTSMMTLNIRIEKPDIILVESLDSKDCMAMVLNMECAVKYRHRNQSTVADGGISELQLYIRKFSDPTPTESSGEPRYILSPTSISVAMSQPTGSGMHVDLALSEINITISPDVLELVNKVIKTVTSSDEDKRLSDDVPIKYENEWDPETFEASKFWFLKTEVGEEASEMSEMNYDDTELANVPPKPVGEICMMSSPSIVFSLELDIGSETLPMLVMQASLTGMVKDWSSSLLLESTWAMQVSYYNIQRAMWEPVIEPVEILENSKYKHAPWELNIRVGISGEENLPAIIDMADEEAAAKAIAEKRARTSVLFSSNAQLDITVSRSGLEALTALGAAFAQATAITDETDQASSVEVLRRNKYEGAPFVFHNYTGLSVKLVFDDKSDFCVHSPKKKSNADYREVVLETNSHVPLQLRRPGANIVKLNEPSPPRRLDVQIEGLGDIQIPVERADKRFFPLGKKPNADNIGLLSEVAMLDASLNISLRSIVQVQNNLSVSVLVYYMKPRGNEVSLLGEVKPGKMLKLPIQAVYTPSAELFFSVEGFTVSVSPFTWRQLQQELQVTKLLHCNTKEKGSIEKFYLWVVGDMEQAFLESSNKHTFASSCYNIKLEPAVILQNCLPVDIVASECGLRRSKSFSPGELAHMSHLAPNRASIVILIPNYLEKTWECTAQIPESETEFSVWSFTSHDSPDLMTLDLGMHNKNSNGTQHLSLYCPFWMLNKTGLTLSYRRKKAGKRGSPKKNLDDADVIFHPADYIEPVLFSFRAKNFFGKKKASIRVEFGEWSDKFSLDIAGSSGVVYCKNEGRTYQVGVTNTLSFNSLTKMVVFMPFIILTNYAPFDVEYQEAQRPGDPWHTVEKKSCASVWPITEKSQKLFIFRVRGSPETTAPMVITEEHATCLKLANEYGGLHLEVQMCEGGTNITVRQYTKGHAPALIINFSPHTIKVYEKDNVNIRHLASMHRMMFTWDVPAGPRVLILRGQNDAVCAKNEVEIDLKQDGIGTMQVEQHTYMSWVSFLNGIQRVILITDDIMLARGVYVAGEAEIMDMDVVLSMKGMGVSLVDDFKYQEIVYVSACHSGIIWEQCKIGSQRYKKLDPHKMTQFEHGYQKYLNEIQINPDFSPLVNIDEKTLVNWSEMRVMKPAGRLLRRTLEPGLWARYSSGAHCTQLHARLHRLQVDQQLSCATFPVSLAPTPPPLSLQNQGIKPFIELSIVEHIIPNSSVRQYKYYKILVQEFHIKIDMELVTALMNMFPQKELTQQEALEAFTKDLESAKQKIDSISIQGTATEQSNFYDYLHLSPIKVHVSFSLGNSTTIPTFIGTLLQGIGVTLTDMNDVVFKLSYYERRYQFLTQTELQTQIQKHYTGQALKQLYVLVLGLDVLGNPYGLVVGLKKGVEDLFYEPFQGAIQGPGEFAEGLYIGVRSLVGHTVGGAAGAFSRITGAMGHGIAALSMDKDYQKQRRDGMNKPPTSLQEGLARSGRGLVMGFVDGVTGVITKPIEGAQEQGVGGFFKGLGRGAVGLVARPTAGLADFASNSLGAVKRAADLSEEVTRRRAPRYLPKNQGVTPYSRQQAEGFIMLSEIEKGKYLATDTYEAHVWVVVSKEAVLCTDKRIVYVEKNNVFGGLQVAWTFLWTELTEAPSAAVKGVFVPTGKKKVFGMFSSSNVGKVILINNEEQKQYLLSQCARLHRQSER